MSNPLSFEMVPISQSSSSNFCNPFSFHGEIPSTSHLHLRQRLPSSPSLSSSYYSFHLTTKYTHTKQSYSTKPIPPPLPNLTTKHSPFSFSLESLHASNVSTPEVDEKAEVEVAKDPSPTNVSTPGMDEKPEVEVAKDLSPSNVTAPEEEKVELEVTKGYTMTQLCDKMIEIFMNEKPKTKDWRKLLVFREEWKKYRESFYNRCQGRAETEKDSIMKQKLIKLGRKVMKIDEEMERHDDLLKEVQQHPMDINTVVADRRKDFTGEFFNYLTLLSDTCYSLEDRDGNQIKHFT